MPKSIVFDIETIPQKNLSKLQQETLDKKVASEVNYTGATSSEDISKIKTKIASCSPYLGSICAISMYHTQTDTTVGLHIGEYTEKAMLERFWALIKNTDLFIGFNQLGFDSPFIINRSLKYDISPTSSKFCNLRRFQRSPHYDIFSIISDWSFKNSVSLDLACEQFGIPSPKEGIVKACNVSEHYDAGHIQLISEYCNRDVYSSYLLFDKMQIMYPVY